MDEEFDRELDLDHAPTPEDENNIKSDEEEEGKNYKH